MLFLQEVDIHFVFSILHWVEAAYEIFSTDSASLLKSGHDKDLLRIKIRAKQFLSLDVFSPSTQTISQLLSSSQLSNIARFDSCTKIIFWHRAISLHQV